MDYWLWRVDLNLWWHLHLLLHLLLNVLWHVLWHVLLGHWVWLLLLLKLNGDLHWWPGMHVGVELWWHLHVLRNDVGVNWNLRNGIGMDWHLVYRNWHNDRSHLLFHGHMSLICTTLAENGHPLTSDVFVTRIRRDVEPEGETDCPRLVISHFFCPSLLNNTVHPRPLVLFNQRTSKFIEIKLER